MWTAARTKDSGTNKLVTTSHTLSPFSIKAWILTQVRLVLWDTNPPSFHFAHFPKKVAIPHPNISSPHLLACAVSSTSLDLLMLSALIVQPQSVHF